ncbi:MAG: D-isomer specific 2-hydroxyacid dehydrogenase family protein [Velocimicrobium sp.]
MKVVAFEVRDDEKADFLRISERLKIEVAYCSEPLSQDNIAKIKGYDAVTILGRSNISSEILAAMKKNNIKYLATRTIGYNHIDTEFAKKIGIRVSNSQYPPNGVAEYTIMLLLMSLRHYKQALFRGNVNDYSLQGLQGRELRNLTIGIIGTGKIGEAVIQNLQGFGCKIIAYNPTEKESLKGRVTYVSLEALYRESDVISLHTPLLDSTYHMIDKDSIAQMKQGVVIINCARGELMSISDVIDAVESEKIGALALDVFEKEDGIYHHDLRSDIISNKDMAYLRQFPNVIMTQHMAFYTDAAVCSMVEGALESLYDLYEKGESEYEL